MNLDELRTVQSKERSKDSLQHLRESFYADVGEYIAGLKEQREAAAERADSPFDDPEVNRLTDEINTAEEVVEAIYERRVGKVVKRASLAAAGMPADEEGLTAEEQELFNELVERIETNKAAVLDVLAGESADAAGAQSESAPGGSADPATPDAATPDPGEAPTPTGSGGSSDDVSAADVMGGESPAGDSATPDDDESDETRPAAAEAAAIADADAPAGGGADGDAPASADAGASADVPANGGAGEERADSGGDPLAGLDERTTVRITSDVGEIFGVDERTYDLESEDVVTLPEENAAPLVERGAAEKLE